MRERMKKTSEVNRKANENNKIYLKIERELALRSFFAVSVMFLFLAFIETVWRGSLTTYTNLNSLLIIVIVFGILTVVITKEEAKIPREVTPKDYALTVVTGFACVLIVWYMIQSTGLSAYAISMMAGILMVLISILILMEE
jgi:hypothetical protein